MIDAPSEPTIRPKTRDSSRRAGKVCEDAMMSEPTDRRLADCRWRRKRDTRSAESLIVHHSESCGRVSTTSVEGVGAHVHVRDCEVGDPAGGFLRNFVQLVDFGMPM